MKFALILVALLGCANASLSDDFHDLWSLIDVEPIKEVTRNHIANDPDFEAIIAWLKSDFITICQAAAKHEAYIAFVEWLEERDCDISKVIDPFKTLLGYSLPTGVLRGELPDRVATRSFHEWVAEVLELIPTEALIALHKEKKESSADWQEFLDYIKSASFRSFVQDIGQLDEVQALIAKGVEHGIDVEALLNKIRSHMGWTY